MEKFSAEHYDADHDQGAKNDLHQKLGVKKWPEGIERFPKIKILSLDADYREHIYDENTSVVLLQVAEDFDAKKVKEEYDAQKAKLAEYDSDNATTRAEEFRDWLLKNRLAREIEISRFAP